MFPIPCSLVVALMLVAAGSVHAGETYSLTVTVKNKARPEEVQTYKVGNWMYNSVQLPIFYGRKEMMLFCTVEKDPKSNEADSIHVNFSDLSVPNSTTTEGRTISGPVTVFDAYFPYEAGKPIVVLDGWDVLTVQIDEGAAKEP